MATFQLAGLPETLFQHHFGQSDDELRRQDIRRVRATSSTGFPCRVSLEDAEAEEELLLLPYRHHDVRSPYRSAGPIFVRKGATRAVLMPGVIPPYVGTRLISLRAYDADHTMIDADVMGGVDVGLALDKLFDNDSVSYVHLHNAKRGCFSCLATRPVAQS